MDIFTLQATVKERARRNRDQAAHTALELARLAGFEGRATDLVREWVRATGAEKVAIAAQLALLEEGVVVDGVTERLPGIQEQIAQVVTRPRGAFYDPLAIIAFKAAKKCGGPAVVMSKLGYGEPDEAARTRAEVREMEARKKELAAELAALEKAKAALTEVEAPPAKRGPGRPRKEKVTV